MALPPFFRNVSAWPPHQLHTAASSGNSAYAAHSGATPNFVITRLQRWARIFLCRIAMRFFPVAQDMRSQYDAAEET